VSIRGPRDPRLTAVRRMIAARLARAGLDHYPVGRWVAIELCTSEAYAAELLVGRRRRGRMWQRLQRLLDPEEIAAIEAAAGVNCNRFTEAPEGAQDLSENSSQSSHE
jgi:hypothetical protein